MNKIKILTKKKESKLINYLSQEDGSSYRLIVFLGTNFYFLVFTKSNLGKYHTYFIVSCVILFKYNTYNYWGQNVNNITKINIFL